MTAQERGMLRSWAFFSASHSVTDGEEPTTNDLESGMAELSYDVELQPGETLQLPESVVNRIGPSRWRIIIEPIQEDPSTRSVRGHSSFLADYAPEDEGLYDDYPSR